MNKSKIINYSGFTLFVSYNETKYVPATRMDPAEGGEITIEEIFVEDSDINIVELLADQLDAIKDALTNES